eukprot:TRINITY_DN33048_c0_g1_i1.p1 TRINITY_DN33048_c0_g1~~TRINITY_DN33048_c0_g1_i1.p1  ORF type:complete len:311 (-),score=41.76 TRINITY_DN33048_c0_g1_i1:156-1022(-)
MAFPLKAFADLAVYAADEGYPLSVHIPHSLISICRYRDWRMQEGEPQQWLYDLVVSIFTHSQGGGIGCKVLLEGNAPHVYLAKRWDYTWVHAFSYLLTYWSPYDVVFQTMRKPRHPLRLICFVADSFDAITTLAGLVDAARSKFPSNKLLPAMLGVVLTSSGAFCRGLDARSREKQQKLPLAAPTTGMTRGVLWAIMYWYLGHGFLQGRHRNRVLATLTFLWISLDLLEDASGFDAHAHIQRYLGVFLGALRSRLKLGPKELHDGNSQRKMRLRQDAFAHRQVSRPLC